MSIFRKVIVHELSHSSSENLYLHCPVDFASNIVRTRAQKFVDLVLQDVNASDGVNIFFTPATIIRKTTYEPHWSAPDNVFGKATAVGMIATRSEQDYSYKTYFEIWRENQDFGRQNISLS